MNVEITNWCPLYVIDEASNGDSVRAAERLQLLDGIPLLPNATEVPQIAQRIMSSGILPPKAQVDARASQLFKIVNEP